MKLNHAKAFFLQKRLDKPLSIGYKESPVGTLPFGG